MKKDEKKIIKSKEREDNRIDELNYLISEYDELNNDKKELINK